MSQQINLFNPIFLKKKKHFSAATMVQALGLVLVGSVVLSVYTGYEVANLSKEASATSGQLQAAQNNLARINSEYGGGEKSKALEAETQRLEADVKAVRRVLDAVESGDFGNNKGYSEYMRAFSRQIVPGLWLTGFGIHGAGQEIQLQGRTLRPDLVPVYISRLKQEPIMRGRSFATLEMQLARPEPPQGDGSVQSASVQREPSEYVEFSLLSAGIVTLRAAQNGGRTK